MSHVTAEALHDTALSPVLFAEGEDRRQSARVPLARPVKVGPAGGFPEALVSARDLSNEGMFVDADRPVRVGARFCVQIELGEGETAYVAEAEVAYNREHVHGSGFGVRFVDVDADSRAKIDREIARQTEAVVGSPTLVPSILHAVPDVDSDLPTLAPSPSQMMIPTDEVRRAPRADEMETAMPSLPPEPDLSSDLVLSDLPTPEAVEDQEEPKEKQATLRRLSDTLIRVGPGIAVLAGLTLMITMGLALWLDGASPQEAIAAPETQKVTTETHAVLMGQAEPAPVAQQAGEDEAVAPRVAPKNPLPPLVNLDESLKAPAKPATKTVASAVAKPASADKAPVVAKAAKAPAKAPSVNKAKAPGLSVAAQALLGESAPRISVKVQPEAKVLKTRVFHNPERFVVDIEGQSQTLTLPAAAGAVKSVRSGRHPGFVRVVFDIDGALEAGRVERQGDHLTVQLHLR